MESSVTDAAAEFQFNGQDLRYMDKLKRMQVSNNQLNQSFSWKTASEFDLNKSNKFDKISKL